MDNLIFKLRHLKSLEGKPELVSFVLADLAYWYLVRDSHPAQLFILRSRIDSYLAGKIENLLKIDLAEDAPPKSESLGSPVTAGGAPVDWDKVREALIGHQVAEVLDDELTDDWIRCNCDRKFSEMKNFNKHQRVQMKKVLGDPR